MIPEDHIRTTSEGEPVYSPPQAEVQLTVGHDDPEIGLSNFCPFYVERGPDYGGERTGLTEITHLYEHLLRLGEELDRQGKTISLKFEDTVDETVITDKERQVAQGIVELINRHAGLAASLGAPAGSPQ